MGSTRYILMLISVAWIFQGCDYLIPKKSLRIVVPEGDSMYKYAAGQLQELCLAGGYKIEILSLPDAKDAINYIADGKADLGMISNHSIYMAEVLGTRASQVNTVLPLFRRSPFFYVRKSDPMKSIYPNDFDANMVIGLEYLGGEPEVNLRGLLDLAGVEPVYQLTTDTACTAFYFWGTMISPKHKELVEAGWRRISIGPEWVRFIDLNNPALVPFTYYGIPAKEGSTEVHTLYADALLVANADLGEKTIHNFTRFIYQHRVNLMNADRMFQTIDEDHDRKHLLFPLHAGAEAYLRREDPSFIERYADVLALVASIIALAFAAVQTLQKRVLKERKEQLDRYFHEFLTIKENTTLDQREHNVAYNNLFKVLLGKMTEEKLNKDDFNILARLIQQEMVITIIDEARPRT